MTRKKINIKPVPAASLYERRRSSASSLAFLPWHRLPFRFLIVFRAAASTSVPLLALAIFFHFNIEFSMRSVLDKYNFSYGLVVVTSSWATFPLFVLCPIRELVCIRRNQGRGRKENKRKRTTRCYRLQRSWLQWPLCQVFVSCLLLGRRNLSFS